MYKGHIRKNPPIGGNVSGDSVTNKAVVKPSSLTKGKTLGDKEVLKVLNFGNTPECVLLTEGVLRNEELIGETSESPSGLTVGKDTSLE